MVIKKKAEVTGQRNRIKYFDIARGIAMISIIAGHFDNAIVIRFVFTYHVPLFFIISGYFYRNDISKIKKNAIKLIKPYIFTVACVTCLDLIKSLIKDVVSNDKLIFHNCLEVIARNVIAGLYGSGSRTDFLDYTFPAIGAIWFLLALIWAQLAVYGINAISGEHHYSKYIKIISAVTVWLLGYFSAQVTWLPLSIQAGLCAVLFLYTGIWLKNKNWELYIQNQKRGIERTFLVIIMGIWAMAVFFSYYKGNMSLVRCYFPTPIINIAGAIAATHVICKGSFIIENTKGAKFLEFVGKNSLTVLSFHLMELNTFPWGKLILNRVPNMFTGWLLVFVMKLGWCMLGVRAVQHSKRLKRVFS